LAAIAIAIAMLALFASRMDTQAVHNDGLLEVDGDTVLSSTGTGFNPGTTNCGTNSATGDCISTPATYDWNDVCTNGTNNLITVKTPLIGDERTCTRDFEVTATTPPTALTSDTTYHSGSD